MTYSKEELLDALREYAAENGGEPPTKMEADADDTLPSGKTYYRHFESWNAALEKAGFTPRPSSYTEQESLDALRDFNEEHGRPPTSGEANDYDTLPSVPVFTDHFGLWNNAIEKAGFTPRTSKRKSSDKELLDALREYAAENGGKPPTHSEANELDTLPSGATYRRRFGSWNAAIEAAGFTPCNLRHSTEELLDALREYAAENDGEPPTHSEANESDTLPSGVTYQNRFGSWNAALEAAGLMPNTRGSEYSDEELLDALREYAAEHDGERPTHSEVNESDTMPSGATYYDHFGSWNAAVEAAGFTPRSSTSTEPDSQPDNQQVDHS